MIRIQSACKFEYAALSDSLWTFEFVIWFGISFDEYSQEVTF